MLPVLLSIAVAVAVASAVASAVCCWAILLQLLLLYAVTKLMVSSNDV